MTSFRIEKLARAAMLGLLAATQSACTGATGSTPEGSEDDEQDPVNMGGDGDGDVGSGGSTDGAAGGADSGETGGDGGVGGSEPVMGVTSTEIIPDLTLEEFTEMCDEAAGTVEIHSHCGGVVTGKGFSYDSDTDAFTEHTCAGYNTCTGFSCVLDD